jgi:hypothetical protein
MKHFFVFLAVFSQCVFSGPLYVMIVKNETTDEDFQSNYVCRFGIGDANANTRIASGLMTMRKFYNAYVLPFILALFLGKKSVFKTR